MAGRLPPRLVQKKGSTSWHIRVPSTGTGPGYTYSLRTADRQEAEKLFEGSKIVDLTAAARADTLSRQFWSRLVIGRDITLSRARDEFVANAAITGLAPRSLLNYEKTTDQFIRLTRLGRSPIGSITDQHVSDFINRPTLAYSTRRYRWNTMRSFFEYCRQSGWIPANPCIRVAIRTHDLSQQQLITKKKLPFTDEQMDRLMASVDPHGFWYAAMLLARTYGLRIGAIAALEWASLPEFKRIVVFTHKAKVVVDQPLTEAVANWFLAHPRTGDSDYVWPDKAAVVLDLSGASLSVVFSRICAKVGIVDRSFHCFRTTVTTREFERMLDKLGGPEKAVFSALVASQGMAGVQRLIGHATGSSVTASRYFNPQPG